MKKLIKRALLAAGGAALLAILKKTIDYYFDPSLLEGVFASIVLPIKTYVSWWASFWPLPRWLVVFFSLAMLSAVGLLLHTLRKQKQSLQLASDRISELENPSRPQLPRLSADQRRVLTTISSLIEKRKFPTFKDLRDETGFSHLVTEGAIDVLMEKGLIHWRGGDFSEYRASLTPAGRRYLLSPEISSEYLSQGAEPTPH
ncbi:hypothetical protein D3879_16900 [Pseudomonas cavernicola]|uniref:Uncharacterized protein n=1 Tax=Pseudomonas cavernicola TaxID=2320866 RepID=A0A418XB59_9PSED|nr:hypothetical protein [Pseudomonas cavernicola]RJG09746.1 hypothetical protein D3879_16900 [Pseudomonas cavernicola]